MKSRLEPWEWNLKSSTLCTCHNSAHPYILSRARASADMDSACKIYPPTMPKVYTDLTSSESDCWRRAEDDAVVAMQAWVLRLLFTYLR